MILPWLSNFNLQTCEIRPTPKPLRYLNTAHPIQSTICASVTQDWIGLPRSSQKSTVFRAKSIAATPVGSNLFTPNCSRSSRGNRSIVSKPEQQLTYTCMQSSNAVWTQKTANNSNHLPFLISPASLWNLLPVIPHPPWSLSPCPKSSSPAARRKAPLPCFARPLARRMSLLFRGPIYPAPRPVGNPVDPVVWLC